MKIVKSLFKTLFMACGWIAFVYVLQLETDIVIPDYVMFVGSAIIGIINAEYE